MDVCTLQRSHLPHLQGNTAPIRAIFPFGFRRMDVGALTHSGEPDREDRSYPPHPRLPHSIPSPLKSETRPPSNCMYNARNWDMTTHDAMRSTAGLLRGVGVEQLDASAVRARVERDG